MSICTVSEGARSSATTMTGSSAARAGVYFNPSVGIRYKSLNISVGLDLVKLNDPWYFWELLTSLEEKYTTINWQSSMMFKIAYEWGGRR